jgi:hypothetical protein
MADGQVPATMSAGMVGFQRLPLTGYILQGTE